MVFVVSFENDEASESKALPGPIRTRLNCMPGSTGPKSVKIHGSFAIPGNNSARERIRYPEIRIIQWTLWNKRRPFC